MLAAAYLCGAVPSGLWLARWADVDVRASGSGNIGATNVARTAGLRLGLATLGADAAKGALPVVIARALGFDDVTQAMAGLASFFGHIFPIFARFRGGKGIATAAGVFLASSPLALGAALLLFLAVFAACRIVSLASLCAGVSLPITVALLDGRAPFMATAAIVAGSILLTHRENLRRLLSGTEPRFQPRR